MRNKPIQIVAFLLALSFPLNIKLTNVLAAIFCLVCLYDIIKEKRYNDFQPKPLLFSSLILIVVFLFGLFTVDNFNYGLNQSFRRISFFIFPFILILLNKKTLKVIFNSASVGLVIGCLTSGIYLLFNILTVYFNEAQGFRIGFDLLNYYHTYHNFTAPIHIHPTYLGSYFFLAILILLNFIYNSKDKKWRPLSILILFFLLLICLFINSRIILVLVFLGIAFYFLLLMNRLRKKNLNQFWGILVCVLILSVISFALIRNTYIYYRFTDELKWESNQQINSKINKDNGGDSRLARWNSILKLIEQKPILGYGIGNEKSVLEKQFEKDNLDFSAESRYDSHNLYLSYGIQFGLLGFAVLLIYFLLNLLISIQKKQITYAFFTIGLICISLFENYLNNNAGIVFVAFFMNLLLFKNLKKE